jgi:hypothetical protein
MRILIDSGTVEFESGWIGPDADRNSFLASPLGCKAEVFVDNDPYMTYRIRPEPGVVATVSFLGLQLTGISCLFEMPDIMEKDWTEEHELERKKIHDNWLRERLGPPPYRFVWGNVSSEYDPKGCVSDIIINYA